MHPSLEISKIMSPQEAIKNLAQLPLVKFSCNWNGKLYTNRFTSIRSRSYYQVGEFYHGLLRHPQGEVLIINKEGLTEKYRSLGVLFCLNVQHLTLSELTETMSCCDTGYSLEETKGILKKMYSKLYAAHGENMKLSLYVFDTTNLFLGQVAPEYKMKEVPEYPRNTDLYKIIYNLTSANPSVTITVK